MSSRIQDLEQYLGSITEVQARTISAIIDAARAAHPDVVVKIAWNVPQLQIDGKYVLGVSCARNHVSVAPWSADVMTRLDADLSDYDRTENMIRVPNDWSVDAQLIAKMMDARLDELGR